MRTHIPTRQPRPRPLPNTHIIGERPDATPMEIAANRASKLQEAEQASLFAGTEQSFNAFRAGKGSDEAWRALVDSIKIAIELTRLNIANDHADTFTAALQSLAAVDARHAITRSWTLKAAEITALDDAVFIHGIQLRHCSRGELSTAVTRVLRRARAALRSQGKAKASEEQP